MIAIKSGKFANKYYFFCQFVGLKKTVANFYSEQKNHMNQLIDAPHLILKCHFMYCYGTQFGKRLISHPYMPIDLFFPGPRALRME